MTTREPKKYKIPEDLSLWIEKQINTLGMSLDQPKKIAKAVLEVSDHFKSSDSKTPWNSKAHTAAYLAYFFPLNYIRNLKVVDEAKAFGFFEGIDEVIDFGCGPGTGTRALLDQTEIKSFTGIDEERNLSPLYLSHQTKRELFYKMQAPKKVSKSSLLFASYVLNEMEELPSWSLNFEKIVLLEPSTHQAFPKFLTLRDRFIEEGYQILAPCPHHLGCPLSGNKKDWCHDRVHWLQPPWFEKLSSHLPIRNKTLTFTYLIAQKKSQTKNTYQRIVSDALVEKGKTRWLLCQDENKTYLSFLKRQGEPPALFRGDRIQLKKTEDKGQEKRFQLEDLEILSDK